MTFKTGNLDTGNYTQFDSTGHQTMTAAAKPWRDELGDVTRTKSQGTGVAISETESSANFTGTAKTDDYLYTNMQLNHDKDLSAELYPHIHYWQTSAVTPNWLVQHRWQVNGGIKDTTWTDMAATTQAYTYTAGILNQIAVFSSIVPPAGTAISDIAQFRVLRDTANSSTLFAGADPVSNTISMTSFDIHFQINSLGSTDEYTK